MPPFLCSNYNFRFAGIQKISSGFVLLNVYASIEIVTRTLHKQFCHFNFNEINKQAFCGIYIVLISKKYKFVLGKIR